ncbi:MAG: tartrate dehydrogenase/decarboxylase / D-malate dehydrogenase [Solirubrobacteraceae bacterium]
MSDPENNGSSKRVRVAAIPGDGIGPEVVSATIPVLRRAAELDGVVVDVHELDWGGDRYLRAGEAMPADAGDQLRRDADAALFGAVGRPDIPHKVSSWGLILPLRRELGLYANVRPIRAWEGVPAVVAGAGDVDLVVLRENSEGEYADIGGRITPTLGSQVAVEVAVHTREGIERIVRHGFELARRRRRQLTVATKSNALRHGYTLWDEVVADVAPQFAEVSFELVLVDALAARMVQRPRTLDVVVASNLFGDILSDLASVLGGGLGMAPSANVRPSGGAPGLYEPVHGSAPDIAGQGVANPTACLLSAAMLLEDLDAPVGAAAIRAAVGTALADAHARTPDLGGEATTVVFADRVLRALEGVAV